MKLKFVTTIIALSAMLALSALTQAQSRTGLTNPGFEEPTIANDTFEIVKKIPGWQTTDTHFEIWGTGFNKVKAYEGSQFAELNAYKDGALYQDSADIEKGAVVEFSFAHRGRNGEDTMQLTITDLGANNQQGGGDDKLLFSKPYTTGNSDWSVYKSTSEPKILALGNTVRFSYTAIKTTGGAADKSEGNFLDAADFGVGVVTAKRMPKASATNALVLLTLTDDGKDLTFHYTGKMKLAKGHEFEGSTSMDRAGRIYGGSLSYCEFYSLGGDFYRGSTHGGLPGHNTGEFVVIKGLSPGPDNRGSDGVGRSFGINSGELWWDKAYGDGGGTIDVDRKWTVAGSTVDSFLKGSTFLDSGPQVIWTHKTTGSTITLVNGNELNDKQHFYLQFSETEAFVSYKNSDSERATKEVVSDNAFLAPDDASGYTKMKFTAVKHDKFLGLQVDSFVPLDGHQRWLEVGDNHELVVTYRKQGAEPGRGPFLKSPGPFGICLETMWVYDGGGKLAHPDHHYYLTGSGEGIQKLRAKDFEAPHPKGISAGWKLVPVK